MRIDGMAEIASELLERWAEKAQAGRALDLGAGDGMQSRWLARRGFEVDAVEADPEMFAKLQRALSGEAVQPIHVDIREFALLPVTYNLVVASAVLHFLRPTELWPIADRLEASLRPGGLLLAEVLTTDDPGFEAMKQAGAAQVEPNTFMAEDPRGPVHFFSPGELKRLFSHLVVLEYEESRRLAPHALDGYRSGASLVARRPA